MDHRAVAIIPARGRSKRIPRKNLVDLGGLPLIVHTIISAKKSKYLAQRIFVSTEDKEISQTSKKYGANVINRPKHLADDKTSTIDILKHSVEVLSKKEIDFDTVVLLQPTSPFRSSETIDKGIKKLWSNWQRLDAIFSVKPQKFPPIWSLKIKGDILEFLYPNDFSKIRSQDLGKTYEIDGALYVIKSDFLRKSEKYLYSPGKTGYLVANKKESLDIDDEEDLEIARLFL